MREAVIIEAERSAYSISQIDETMTVGELIDYLENFDENSPRISLA